MERVRPTAGAGGQQGGESWPGIGLFLGLFEVAAAELGELICPWKLVWGCLWIFVLNFVHIMGITEQQLL